jgi:hypothetical protein
MSAVAYTLQEAARRIKRGVPIVLLVHLNHTYKVHRGNLKQIRREIRNNLKGERPCS